MPQLDFNWFLPQIFWLVLTFVPLYLFVALYAVPRISSVVDVRKAKVNEDIRKAEKLNNEAVKIEKEYTATIEKARAEGGAIATEALKKANSETIAKTAELDKKVSKMLADSEKKITDLRTKMNKDMLPHQVEITKKLIEKIAGIKVNDEKVLSIINSLEGNEKRKVV